MHGLRGEQRGVWFRRLFEQLENTPGLLAVQPDDGLAFEDFLRLPVGGLHNKMIERRAFQTRPLWVVRERFHYRDMNIDPYGLGLGLDTSICFLTIGTTLLESRRLSKTSK